MARVVVDGRQVACKMFPPGRKHGPQWRAAKEWEEEQRQLAMAGLTTPTSPVKKSFLSNGILKNQHVAYGKNASKRLFQQAATGLERLMAWGNEYLDHARRTMGRQTHVEKEMVLRDFFAFCGEESVRSLDEVTPAKAYAFLSRLRDARGGNVANKYRKNLLAGWTWGTDFIDDFPQMISPFIKVKPFPVEKKDRYVPSEGDVIKVLQQAKGQDLVMLLTLYFMGARRGEVFRLDWKDVDLDAGKIRLTDHKAGNGQQRVRWLQMHPELIKALSWWREARPCNVENVFMQVHCDGFMGQPFRQRRHFMENLCERAGVKLFGFHAIRHKSAAITFEASGLNSAQVLMGHYRATTTDTYVKSAGLYTDQGAILAALGGSGIGQMVGDLLKNKIPQGVEFLEGNCNPEFVTQ